MIKEMYAVRKVYPYEGHQDLLITDNFNFAYRYAKREVDRINKKYRSRRGRGCDMSQFIYGRDYHYEQEVKGRDPKFAESYIIWIDGWDTQITVVPLDVHILGR